AGNPRGGRHVPSSSRAGELGTSLKPPLSPKPKTRTGTAGGADKVSGTAGGTGHPAGHCPNGSRQGVRATPPRGGCFRLVPHLVAGRPSSALNPGKPGIGGPVSCSRLFGRLVASWKDQGSSRKGREDLPLVQSVGQRRAVRQRVVRCLDSGESASQFRI